MRSLAVTTLLVALVLPAAARADIEASEESEELKARMHFGAGEYQEALDIYIRLYSQTTHPTYQRNIGRCYQNMGDADKAISSFREYLRKAPDLPDDQRKQIDGFIEEMEQLKRTKARLPSAPPSPAASPDLVGPPTVTSSGAPDDAGPFYTRVWFWGAVAGAVAAGVVTVLLLAREGGPTGGNLGTYVVRPQ